jgi:hypothetical protein
MAPIPMAQHRPHAPTRTPRVAYTIQMRPSEHPGLMTRASDVHIMYQFLTHTRHLPGTAGKVPGDAAERPASVPRTLGRGPMASACSQCPHAAPRALGTASPTAHAAASRVMRRAARRSPLAPSGVAVTHPPLSVCPVRAAHGHRLAAWCKEPWRHASSAVTAAGSGRVVVGVAFFGFFGAGAGALAVEVGASAASLGFSVRRRRLIDARPASSFAPGCPACSHASRTLTAPLLWCT